MIGVNDDNLHREIKDVLNRTSSQIMDSICGHNEEKIHHLKKELDVIKANGSSLLSTRISNRINLEARRSVEHHVRHKQDKLDKKFTTLCSENLNQADKSLPICNGSRLLRASQYLKGDRARPSTGASSTGKTILRPHRKYRFHRNGTNTNQPLNRENIMTPDDIKRIDPIILSKNVKLTPDQVSVCRLPDKFVPTPRCPIDVSDMVQGTKRWAEHLRWTYFWQKKKTDTDDSDESQFIPKPWYQKIKNLPLKATLLWKPLLTPALTTS